MSGRIDGTLSHFWYIFSDGCADWFVLDTRTERVLSGTEPKMINDAQMKALLDWLDDGSSRVKLVVASVPVFPDMQGFAEDKWGAFPQQRSKILEHIRVNKIRKVVFVSGDVHCSFTSQLGLASEPDFLVHSIVSSSFFWPYPHPAQRDFLFGHPLLGIEKHEYTSKRTSPLHLIDNFARIEVDPAEVRVSFYERKGAQLGKLVRLSF